MLQKNYKDSCELLQKVFSEVKMLNVVLVENDKKLDHKLFEPILLQQNRRKSLRSRARSLWTKGLSIELDGTKDVAVC
jgi:hypothetical protein